MLDKMATGSEIDFGSCKTEFRNHNLICKNCDVQAALFCVTCDGYMCDACATSHTASGAHIDHFVIPGPHCRNRDGGDTRPYDSNEDNAANLSDGNVQSSKDDPTHIHADKGSSGETDIYPNTLRSSQSELELSGQSEYNSNVHVVGSSSILVPGDRVSECDIGCVVLIDDETVVLTDISNKKLKRFRYKNGSFECIQCIEFHSEPWCFKRLSQCVYIVTLPSIKSYQEVILSNGEISLGRLVNIGGHYPVCELVKDRFIFLDTENRAFFSTDLYGRNGKRILSDIEQRFGTPNFLLYHRSTDVLYINVPESGVLGVAMETHAVCFHYSSPGLEYPLELLVARENLLIIGHKTRNIHVVSFGGKLMHDISLADLQTPNGPSCICYIEEKDVFLLSNANDYTVMQLKIKF